MSARAKRLHITGKVQGVWYRASTVEQAQALGLAGWARNCADGSVEVLAVGDAAAIEALIEWAHEGPPNAVVAGVSATDIPLPDPTPIDFTIEADT